MTIIQNKKMKKNKKKIISFGIVLGILLLLGIAAIYGSGNTITGAITGTSAVYQQCLTKYGRDFDGQFDWNKIAQCRDYYVALEKGRDAAIPRLCLSSPEREECT